MDRRPQGFVGWMMKVCLTIRAAAAGFWSALRVSSVSSPYLLLLLISAFQLFSVSAFSQGSLTPPGGPMATMKSLDQIEARTPISSAPFTINSSGSYYLTNNVSVGGGDAIVINASGVNLDLNGFTISSTAASANGNAITIGSALRDVTVRNGAVVSGVTVTGSTFSGSGFSEGVAASGSSRSVHISSVAVSGCLTEGINISGSNSSLVESCTVNVVGDEGIVASVVRNSTARNCGNDAILADEVSDSDGAAIAGKGIYGNHAAQNCSGVSDSNYGVVGDVVQNCYGQSNTGTGLSGFTVQSCHGASNAGTGLNGVAITDSYASNNSTANPTITGTTIHNCYGFNSAAGPAISATYTVADSVGYSSGGNGINVISAKTVSNSYATAATTAGATGIAADVVQNCSATVFDTNGPFSSAIHANDSVINSVGVLTGTNGVGTAILAPNISNCYGMAGTGNTFGISGANISFSFGSTSSLPGAGINVQNGTVSFCSAQNVSGDAIFADRSVVKNSQAVGSLNGIRVGNVCLIEGNTCDANTTGIRTIGLANRLDGNRVSCPAGGNAFVIESGSTNNFIIRNTVRENGSNPFILTGANNHYGPLVNVSGVVGGDISGTTNANNPWANFIY